jgi:hypothetical protein
MAEACDKCGLKHSRRALRNAEAILNGKRSIETAKGRRSLCGLADMIDFEGTSEKRYAECYFIRMELESALKKRKIKFTKEMIDKALPLVEAHLDAINLNTTYHNDMLVATYKIAVRMIKDGKVYESEA